MIRIEGLRFHYGDGGFRLDIPELHIDRGRKVALIGPSGAGKTTLINLIAGILTPDTGRVRVDGVELGSRSDGERRVFRISRIGFVFQEFGLLEYLDVRNNVLLPYRIGAALTLSPDVDDKVRELAASMQLDDKLGRYPKTLSHGERQRVAICRALVASPSLLIADEPTGNLDPLTAQTILGLLLRQADQHGSTLLMVTHNHDLLGEFDRIIDMRDFAAGRTS